MDLVQNIETVRMCMWTSELNHSSLFSLDACVCMCVCVVQSIYCVNLWLLGTCAYSDTTRGCNEVLKCDGAQI